MTENNIKSFIAVLNFDRSLAKKSVINQPTMIG